MSHDVSRISRLAGTREKRKLTLVLRLFFSLTADRYEKYEKQIIFALGKVHQLSGGQDKWALKQALDMMLACASCMQLSLIHCILPKGGRQLSILFSPSRCQNQALKKLQEKPDQCVCCSRRIKLVSKKKRAREEAALDLDQLEDDGDETDDVDDMDEEEDQRDSDRNVFYHKTVKGNERLSNKIPGTGDIVPIDSNLCKFADMGIRHFACESCLTEMTDNGKACPKCADLLARGKDCSHEIKIKTEDTLGPAHIYCREVFGGFVASAKLEKIVSNFKTGVPAEDKVLIISFFKGCLDLLEAMFHEHNVEVARYDGDTKCKKARQAELDRFKAVPSCRVLLMTAKTGGCGLNIVEANHVWFTERYCA